MSKPDYPFEVGSYYEYTTRYGETLKFWPEYKAKCGYWVGMYTYHHQCEPFLTIMVNDYPWVKLR